MRNCIEMTRLISESQERKLTFVETVEMHFHTAMCDGCRNFKKNTDSLRYILQAQNSSKSGSNDTEDAGMRGTTLKHPTSKDSASKNTKNDR